MISLNDNVESNFPIGADQGPAAHADIKGSCVQCMKLTLAIGLKLSTYDIVFRELYKLHID